jgi:hypothetical protein
MKKGLVYALIGLGIGVTAYSTYYIFRLLNNARIDSRTVSVEEALQVLEKSR